MRINLQVERLGAVQNSRLTIKGARGVQPTKLHSLRSQDLSYVLSSSFRPEENIRVHEHAVQPA